MTLYYNPMNEFDMRSLSGFGLPREVVIGTYHMYGRVASCGLWLGCRMNDVFLFGAEKLVAPLIAHTG